MKRFLLLLIIVIFTTISIVIIAKSVTEKRQYQMNLKIIDQKITMAVMRDQLLLYKSKNGSYPVSLEKFVTSVDFNDHENFEWNPKYYDYTPNSKSDTLVRFSNKKFDFDLVLSKSGEDLLIRTIEKK